MTRTLLALAAALAFAMPASAQTTILSEDFETDGNGTRYTVSFVDNAAETSDYFRRTDGSDIAASFANPSGFYFAAQDIDGITDVIDSNPDDDQGAERQTLTFSGIDITGFSSLMLSIDVAEDQASDGAEDWDTTDLVHASFVLNGTPPSSFETGYAIWFDSNPIGDTDNTNQPPFLNFDFDDDGGDSPEDTEVTDVFTTFSRVLGFNSEDATTVDLVITFDLDAGDEDIAIDNITLVGMTGSGTSVTTSSVVGWRLLSVPTTLTVDDLAQINLVSGAGGYTTGANCQVNGITNLFTEYLGDENANQNGGYVAPGSGATIEPGAGFFWYFFGDTPGAGQPAECQDGTNTSTTRALPIVLNADGTSGLVAGFPTVTIPDANDADGFYMLGNPYDTGYDVSAIEAVEAGTINAVALQAGVQLWDPEIRGYVVYTADGTGDVTAADADDVSIWQGFFVERSGADPGTDVTFNFNPEGRQMDVEGDGFVARQAAGSPLLSFQVTDGMRTGAAAVVRFEEGADAAWDRFDLSKLAPFTSDFAQIGPVGQNRDGALVTKAVESLSSALNGSVDVPFAFTTSAAEGTFTVTWPRVELPDGWTATLADLVTGEATDLLAAEAYTFEHSASAPAERFVLGVSAPAVANEEGAQAFELSALAPNPTAGTARMALTVEASEAVTVQVYDALGRLVATVFDDVVTAGATRAISVPTASLSAGVYMVRVQGVSFAETRRLTVTR